MYILNKAGNFLEEVKETTFYESDIKERQHIEEWLRKKPEVMGEELLIIGHEYDKFEVNERLDLLALDKDGKLVIIEVKRDNSGSAVDFQALKYASYCSRLTAKDILDIYREYIDNFGLNLNPEQEIMYFLQVEDEDVLNEKLNNSQRIIVIGKEFDKRILSVCTWLYENSIDVKCIYIKPYELNNEILIDIDQIIPSDKIEDYYINKKPKQNKTIINKDNNSIEFLASIVNEINKKSNLNIKYLGKKYYFGASRIKDKGIEFVVSYSKRNNTVGISAEAWRDEGVKRLKKVYDEFGNEISEKLGTKLYLESGAKNSQVYRMFIRISMDGVINLLDSSEEITNKYLLYKSILEDKVRNLE